MAVGRTSTLLQLDSTKKTVGRDVQSFSIGAKRAVAGASTGDQSPQQFTLRADDINPPGAASENGAIFCHGQAIWKSREFLHVFFAIKQDFTFAQCLVVFDGERHPNGIVGITLRDVKSFLIWRESDAIGAGKFFTDQGQRSIGVESIDTAEIKFTSGIGFSIRQTVRWVSEEN